MAIWVISWVKLKSVRAHSVMTVATWLPFWKQENDYGKLWISWITFFFVSVWVPFVGWHTLTLRNLTSLCICQYSEGRSATPCKTKNNVKQLTMINAQWKKWYIRSLVSSFAFFLPFVFSFVLSFVALLTRSFVYSFVRSFRQSFARSFVRFVNHLFSRSLAHSFVRSVNRSFVRSLAYLCTRFVFSFARSFVSSFFSSLARLLLPAIQCTCSPLSRLALGHLLLHSRLNFPQAPMEFWTRWTAGFASFACCYGLQ